MPGDHAHRLLGVSGAERLVQGAVLAVVRGNARGRENLVLHGVPLGMAADVVDVAVDRRHQRIVGGIGEELMELAIPFGEVIGVAARGLDPGELATQTDHHAGQPTVAHQQVGADSDDSERNVARPGLEKFGEIFDVGRPVEHLRRAADAKPGHVGERDRFLVAAADRRQARQQAVGG